MAKRIPLEEIKSKKYGMLTVLEEVSPTYDSNLKPARRMLCRCDCGRTYEVRLSSLLHSEIMACIECGYEKASKKRTTHNMTGTPLYKIWGYMKDRCYNKNKSNYHRYGGRGIKMCQDWRDDPQSFISWALSNGYKEGLSIDRINNDDDYKPSNCQFISQAENSSKGINRCLN